MRAIGVLLVVVSIIILGFSVVFPRNLGEHTPVWEVKERFFGDAYRELRSEYFISMNMEQQWRDQNNILFIWNDGDIFRITEVYLKVKKEIANNCKITSSGIIEWKRDDLGKRILADALTDTPLRVLERQGDAEYSLDKSEDSIKEFEEATGIKADELLDTVSLIRRVYGETLNKLIEMRYQELCAKIKKSSHKCDCHVGDVCSDMEECQAWTFWADIGTGHKRVQQPDGRISRQHQPLAAEALFSRAMSQVPCLHEHLANAARVEYPAALLRCKIDAPSACCGVFD